MANYFSQNIKQSFCLADIDPSFEFMMNPAFSGLNQDHASGYSFLMDSFSPSPCPGLFVNEENSLIPSFTDHHQPILISTENDHKKRKSTDSTPESSSANSSVYSSHQSIDNGAVKSKITNSRRGKKVKGNEKEDDEKEREVIHVRARRGQATDSHSLAERARRGKINERLRCLQDIVPGCYKTMGMAVMLDEIINYVQSLQNQVEFLSMKLTAASTFHDFNSNDIDILDTIQRAKAFEALKVENVTSPPQFGHYPQLPYSR